MDLGLNGHELAIRPADRAGQGSRLQDLAVTQRESALPTRPPEASFLRGQKGGKEPLKGGR